MNGHGCLLFIKSDLGEKMLDIETRGVNHADKMREMIGKMIAKRGPSESSRLGRCRRDA